MLVGVVIDIHLGRNEPGNDNAVVDIVGHIHQALYSSCSMVGVPGKYKGMSPYQVLHTNLPHRAKSIEVAILAGLAESNAITRGRSARNVSTMVANVADMNEKLSSSSVLRTIEVGLDLTHRETPNSQELFSLKRALSMPEDTNLK